MADLTCTTAAALYFLNARKSMRLRGVVLPFPPHHMFNRIERKLNTELTQYEHDRIEQCDLLCEKDGEGKPVMVDGNYQFTAEHLALLNEKLTPLLAETLTITNVEKVDPVTLGDVVLTDAEEAALSPFLADGD